MISSRCGRTNARFPVSRFVDVDFAVVHAAVKHIHVAQKIIDKRRSGVIVDLFRAADLLDAALVHHRDNGRQLERLLLIVRDEHAGDVHLIVQLAQPLAQFLTHLGVERAERFVEQQHASARQQARGRAPRAGAGRRKAARDSGAPDSSSWIKLRAAR